MLFVFPLHICLEGADLFPLEYCTRTALAHFDTTTLD